ncbi:MAG: hypothetical protein Q9165_005461 [Trypethelium subeluteriae]
MAHMKSYQQMYASMQPSTQETMQEQWLPDLDDFNNMTLPIQDTSQDGFATADYSTISQSFNSNIPMGPIHGAYADNTGSSSSSSGQLIPEMSFSSVGNGNHDYARTDSQLLALPNGYSQPSFAGSYSHPGQVSPQGSLMTTTYPNTQSNIIASQAVTTQPSVVGTSYPISDTSTFQESLLPTSYADSFSHHTTTQTDNDFFREVPARDILASQSGSCFDGSSAQSHNTSNSPVVTSDSPVVVLDKPQDGGSDTVPDLNIPPEADHGLLSTALEHIPPLNIPKPKSPKRNGKRRNGSSTLPSNTPSVKSRNSHLNGATSGRSYPTPEGIIPGWEKPLPVEFGFLEFDRNPEAYPKIKDAVLDASGNIIIGNSGDPLRHIVGRNGQPVLPNEISKQDLLKGRNPYYWQASHPLLRQKDIFDRITDYTPAELGKQGRVNALANVRNRWRAKHGGLDFIPKTIPEDKKSFSKWDLQRVDSLSSEQIRQGIVWEICPDEPDTMRDPFSGTRYKIPPRKLSSRVPMLMHRLMYLKDKAKALGVPSWEKAKSLEILNNSRFIRARANRQKQDSQSFNGSHVSVHGSERASGSPDPTGQDGNLGPAPNEIFTQEQAALQVLNQLDDTPPPTETAQLLAENSSFTLLDDEYGSNLVDPGDSSLLSTQNGMAAVPSVATVSQSKKRKSLHDDKEDEANGVSPDVIDRPTKRVAVGEPPNQFFDMTGNAVAGFSLPVSTAAQDLGYSSSNVSFQDTQDPFGLGATPDEIINLNWA